MVVAIPNKGVAADDGNEQRLDRLRRRLLVAQKKQSSSEDSSSSEEEATSEEDSTTESDSDEEVKKTPGEGDENSSDEESEEISTEVTSSTPSDTSTELSGRKAKTRRSAKRTVAVLSKPDDKIIVKNKLTSRPGSRGKKRRRRRPTTICLTHCRYELVRSLSRRYGLIEAGEDTAWNIYWTDYSVSLERAMDMRRFQIVNHFPGMNEICRKDLLARNLNRMKRVFPDEYNIYPMTWCLPADNNELQAYAMSRRGKTFICKPEMGCQGRGIFLIKNIKDLNPFGRIICQIYIQKPFLIDHLKFDLRIYVLITSCDPLRIWVYKEGLARFATAKYRQPTQNNTENSYMHLTNYAVNKFSRDFVVDGDSGTKRKLTTVCNWLFERGYDVAQLEKEIDDVILKTILSAQPILKHHYKTCFPQHDICSACFEILGFDVLIDHKLKPFVIEVNHSPSFHTDTPLDQEIKEALLNDTFAMLRFKQLDRVRIEKEDRRRVQERLNSKLAEVKTLMDGKKAENNPTSNRRRAQLAQAKAKELAKEAEEKDKALRPDSARRAAYVEAQFKWELENKGDYRLIYPLEDSAKYDKFLAQNQVSLYQETAASQARANLTRAQMDEYNQKKQLEEQKRFGGNGSPVSKESGKVRPESPASDGKKKPPKQLPVSILPVNSSPGGVKGFNLCHIVGEEDCERVRGLIQRGLLIRSLGIELQAYQLLCKVGSLKKADHDEFRRKHGFVLTNYQAASAHILARKDNFVYPSNASSSNPSRTGYSVDSLFDPAAGSTSGPASARTRSKPRDVRSASTLESPRQDRKLPVPRNVGNPGHREEYFQAKLAQMEPMKPQVPPLTSSSLFTMRWSSGAKNPDFINNQHNHHVTTLSGSTQGNDYIGRSATTAFSNTRDAVSNSNSRELPTGAAQIKAIAKMGPNFGGIPLQSGISDGIFGRSTTDTQHQQRQNFAYERKVRDIDAAARQAQSKMRRWGTPVLDDNNAVKPLAQGDTAANTNKSPVIPRYQFSPSTTDGGPPSLGRLLPTGQSPPQMSASQTQMPQRRTMTPSLESASVIFPRRGNNKINFSARVTDFSRGDMTPQLSPFRRLGPKSPSSTLLGGSKKDPVITYENAPLFLKGFHISPGAAVPAAFKLS